MSRSEGKTPKIGYPGYTRNAAQYAVSRLLTDAVFNQDIRAIQLVINRVDGGLPKDCDVSEYQTLFGDCINAVLAMEEKRQTRVFPEDTVMMALSKALYDIAVRDIYQEALDLKAVNPRASGKPSTEDKKDRDAAMRMVLERAGGRKTTPLLTKAAVEVGMADWVKGALSSAEE